MGYEAFITINCERFSTRIVDVIELLNKLKWNIYNSNDLIEYLPIGDIDNYDWQYSKLTENELKNIINYKQDHNEVVGLHLYYNCTEAALSFLANSTNEIDLSLNIYRKKLRDSTTDFPWYFQNIIIPLRANGCIIDNLTFEEYTD